jgi:hypothetical protein
LWKDKENLKRGVVFVDTCVRMRLVEGQSTPHYGRDDMYTHTNFATKKALKEAIKAGERVTIYQPGPFGGNEPTEGKVALEGPHYPKPHKWYATATLQEGVVVKVT